MQTRTASRGGRATAGGAPGDLVGRVRHHNKNGVTASVMRSIAVTSLSSSLNQPKSCPSCAATPTPNTRSTGARLKLAGSYSMVVCRGQFCESDFWVQLTCQGAVSAFVGSCFAFSRCSPGGDPLAFWRDRVNRRGLARGARGPGPIQPRSRPSFRRYATVPRRSCLNARCALDHDLYLLDRNGCLGFGSGALLPMRSTWLDVARRPKQLQLWLIATKAVEPLVYRGKNGLAS